MSGGRRVLVLPAAILAAIALAVTGSFGQAGRSASSPELPRSCVDASLVPPTGRTIAVAAGGDFQAALNAVQPGGVVTLEAGAKFIGNFTLPNKPATGWIVVRTAAPDSTLPAQGTRVTPPAAGAFPKLISPNGRPVLTMMDAHRVITLAPDKRCWAMDADMSRDMVVAACLDGDATTVSLYRLPDGAY